MRSVLGLLILTAGALGATVAYWGAWVMSFLIGQSLGIVTDQSLGPGLFFAGALAGGAAGLLAGSTAFSGMGLFLSRPPTSVFFATWIAWGVLGAIVSAFLQKSLSTTVAAGLLGGCHLLVYM